VLKPGIVSILQAGAPVLNRDWLVQIALITMVFVGDISIVTGLITNLELGGHHLVATNCKIKVPIQGWG
jgi:hypothetical protein